MSKHRWHSVGYAGATLCALAATAVSLTCLYALWLLAPLVSVLAALGVGVALFAGAREMRR